VNSFIQRSIYSIQYWLHNNYYAKILGVAPSRIRIQGPCHIHGGGDYRLGSGILIRSNRWKPVELYCRAGAVLQLNDGCFINQGVHIVCGKNIVIGKNCLLGDEVLIMDSDFHGVGGSDVKSEPVVLESGVWVGSRAIILKGVKIGTGAVIGAGSVVTKSIPPRSLAVGNPAILKRQW